MAQYSMDYLAKTLFELKYHVNALYNQIRSQPKTNTNVVIDNSDIQQLQNLIGSASITPTGEDTKSITELIGNTSIGDDSITATINDLQTKLAALSRLVGTGTLNVNSLSDIISAVNYLARNQAVIDSIVLNSTEVA